MTLATVEEGNFDVPQLRNLRIGKPKRPTPPGVILKEIEVTEEADATVRLGRKEAIDIIHGKDDRLLVIVGPCSIHDPKAALEYANRLAGLRIQFSDRMAIMMRVYLEKPRTTVGWPGLAKEPGLDGTEDYDTGRRLGRQLMVEVNHRGVPVATEVLELHSPPYFSDLIAYGAIGARTSGSPNHRMMASGLSFPVAFKNAPGGSQNIAIDGMVTAREEHSYPGIDDEGYDATFPSMGNSDTQLILRGTENGPNYGHETVVRAVEELRKQGLSDRIVVDCSHANSNKDYQKQPTVFEDVLSLRKKSKDYRVCGVMIESNLNPGKQKIGPLEDLEYGVSVTDGCVGWDQTEEMLLKAYQRL